MGMVRVRSSGSFGFCREMLSENRKTGFSDAPAKSHDHSFEVLQKSKIGNFSVVTLRAATLKIPDLVFFDATAKSHDHSFEVLQKSKIGNFSVVTLRAAALKIPDLVFFTNHPKFLIGTFGSRVSILRNKQKFVFLNRIDLWRLLF